MTETPPAAPLPPASPAALDWVSVALLALLAAVFAVFGVFFLPAYSGSTPLPVVVIAVALALAVIPRVSYRLTLQMFAAFLPVMLWFVVTVGLFLTRNSLYPGLPVAWPKWQFALLLGVGVLTSAASVGLLWGDHLRAQLDSARARDSAAPDSVQRRSGDGGY